MSYRFLRVASLGMLASVALLGVQTSANAFTLADNYWGGYKASGNTDVIANPGSTGLFDIISVDVNRVGTGGKDLEFKINTGYNPTVGEALGTTFGALFLSTNPIILSGAAPYASDTFFPSVSDPAGNTGRFTHVLDFSGALNFVNPGTAITTGSGNVALYELLGDGTDVQASYWPNPSDTVGTNFRQAQAVDFKGDSSQATGDTGTWLFDAAADTLTFTLINGSALFGDNFGLAWAMTCANDVILGNVNFPPEVDGETPIPGALPLFAAGLGLFGFLNHRRKRSLANKA